ncbi:MAG: hypothetical protein IPH88_08240 [Bacteroidales bacterium]|nr:hypothetical protein [Bacteroidales bacterium]
MKHILTGIIFFTIALSFSVKGQETDAEKRIIVLEKGIIDSTLVFGKWTEGGQAETHLTYLGQVLTNQNQIFKIMNSLLYWGVSPSATSRILVFNQKNEYIGNYCLTMTYDLPDKLENNTLIFYNTDNDDCDSKMTTIIDLSKGLPKEIFLKCKGEYGDIYSFSQE